MSNTEKIKTPEIDATAELSPLSPEEKALLEIITLPDSIMMKKWQPIFEKRANQAVGELLNPGEQQAVAAAKAKAEWNNFGQPDGELPPGLAIYYGPGYPGSRMRTDRNHTRIIYDPAGPVGDENYPAEEFLNIVLTAGQSPFGDYDTVKGFESAYFETEFKYDKLVKALADVIKTQPRYALLKSFAVDRSAMEEVGLTDIEKLTRMAEKTEEIRRKAGIDPNTEIGKQHYNENIELQRFTAQLDDETVRKPNTRNGGAKERLRTWVLTNLSKHIVNTYADAVVGGFSADVIVPDRNNSFGFMFMSTDGRWELAPNDSKAQSWFSSLSKDEYPVGPFALPAMDEAIFQHALREIYLLDQPFETGLEAAVMEVAEAQAKSLRQAGELLDTLRTILRRPKGPIYTELSDSYIDSNQAIVSGSTEVINVVDRQTYLDNLHKKLGEVLYPVDREEPSRLISFFQYGKPRQVPEPSQPEAYSQFDLVVKFDPSFKIEVNDAKPRDGYGREPYIVGYEAVAVSGDRWYFKKAETDPYQGADNIQIEPQNLEELVDAYRYNGFTVLAEALSDVGEVSVSNLARIIRENSDYTFDTGLMESLPYAPTLLGGFSHYVRNGRLQLQCTGAASFLGLSLEHALPGSVARQQGGWLLTNEPQIAEARHAQTLLSLDGKQHMLDATPYAGKGLDISGNFASPPSALGRFTKGLRRAKSQTPAPTPNAKTPELVNVPKPKPPIPPVELSELVKQSEPHNIQAHRERLEDVLQIYFDLPSREALIDHMGALARSGKINREADPIWHSLEAVVRTKPVLGTQAEAIAAQAKRLSEYNQRVTEAWRKNHSVPNYDPELIELMCRALS